MRKFSSMILFLALFLSLSGCQAPEGNHAAFYYSRSPGLYQYFEEDGVIHSEIRDLTGHRKDLRYMVGLYLAGPLEEGLTIPFTKATRLISVQEQEGCVLIELSDHTDIMTDAEFSLACAGLTMTCLEFTSCREVTIVSGSRSVTMGQENILLFDSLPPQETIGG